MEAIIGQGLALVAVNAILFLVIGMVILENPLKLGILCAVFLANCAVFFFTALFSSENPQAAMVSLIEKAIPFAVVFAGLALLIVVQLGGESKRRKVPRSSSRFVR